jgi:pimeloyl-ACP methyl ester carboxylesterase
MGSRIYAAVLSISLFVSAFLVAFPAHIYAAGGSACSQYTLPVTLTPTDPTIYHIAGRLCSNGQQQGKTIQLLVHGFTYNHLYWDFPYPNSNASDYSYVQSALGAGYATFTIDMLGAGESDHPADPSNITSENDAYILHQIINDLKDGTVGGTAFNKVILMTHSMGSVAAAIEAARYNDASGLVLSGALHQEGTNAPVAFAALYPAFLDPKFAGNPTYANPGYETTRPGARGTAFYNAADADSNVIALDDTLKDAGPSAQFSDLSVFLDPSTTQQIHVPVLTAVGQYDNLFCDNVLSCTNNAAVQAREAPDYAPQACLEAYVLPNSGHDINLHLNANKWYKEAIDWTNRRVGNSSNPPAQPCQ